MRTFISVLSVLVMAGISSAADSTATASHAAATVAPVAAPAQAAPIPAAAPVQTAAPAPAPNVVTPPELAPAKSSSPVTAPVEKQCPMAATCPAKCASAQPLVSWYGMAMLRLRDDIITNYPNSGPDAGKSLESAAFSYQLGYKLGVKAQPVSNTLLQFEIGNDWYATDEADGMPGNYWTKRDPLTPWFDLAYAQWDPGYLHIQAGIIPVMGTPLMDLLGVSLLYNRSYHNAAHVPWGVVTNFSQTGLRLGAPILKGPFSLGVDAMSAIIEQRPIYAIGVDSLKVNASAVEFDLDVPMTVGGLCAKPQAFIIPNRSFNKENGHSEIEFGSGINLNYKLNDGVMLRAGYGYARNSNRSTASNTNWVYDTYTNPNSMFSKTVAVDSMLDSAKFDRWGNNMNIGTTVKLGPGTFDFDFNLSNEQNAYDKDVDDWYPFFDFKYGWALSKNFILMPRIRLFFSEPKIAYNNELKTRPELIFFGTF